MNAPRHPLLAEGICPVAMLRVAPLPSSQLGALTSERCREAADVRLTLETELAPKISRLTEAIEYAISQTTEAAPRRRLLRLKRDAYNGRYARLHGCSELPADVSEPLHAVLQHLTAMEEASTRLRSALTLDAQETREAVLGLLDQPAFRDAIQRVFPDEEKLRTGKLKARRARRLTDSILNYLVRVSAKTSPLARQCVVVHGGLGVTGGPAQAWNAPRIVARTRPNIAWTGSLLVGQDRRLTLTQTASDGSRSAFVRTESVFGSRMYLAREHLSVVGGMEPLLDALRAAGPMEQPELVALAEHHHPGKGTSVFQFLLQHGLLTPHVAHPMSDWTDLPAIAESYPKLAPALRSWQQLVRDYPELPVNERTERSQQVSKALVQTLTPDAKVPKDTLVFEDLVAPGSQAVADVGKLGTALDDLRTLLSVGVAASDAYPRMRTLAAFLERHHGREDVPLLLVLQAYAKEGLADAKDINPLDDPLIKAFMSIRRKVRRAIREAFIQQPDGSLTLDTDTLVRLARPLAPVPQLTRIASVLAQVIDEGDGPAQLVLNGALPGGGTVYGRFLDEGDEGYHDIYSRWLEGVLDREPVELHGMQAFNGNLHPVSTRRTVDYPGMRSAPEHTEALGLGQLTLRVGDDRLPELRHPEVDGPIALVDVALHAQHLAPRVRRLLRTLAHQISGNLWLPQPGLRPTVTPGVAEIPRVTVGQVVLQRRTIACGPQHLSSSEDLFEQFLSLRRLTRDHQLGSAVFVRLRGAVDPARPDVPNPTVERKPAWLDLSSPAFLQALSRSFKDKVETIQLIEALPDPRSHGVSPTGTPHASEWAFELSIPPLG